MANLVLNGKSIDNIDDIAENFVEADVLRAFCNGSLSAWLEEYDYEEELERVRSIKPTASSIRVLAGISEALNLDDDVIAEAAARREDQQRKEEAARKAREEQQRRDEEERQHKERDERKSLENVPQQECGKGQSTVDDHNGLPDIKKVTNWEEAINAYRGAAKEGNVYAQGCLAFCYVQLGAFFSDGSTGVRIFDLARNSAKQGEPIGQKVLGYCLRWGIGTEVNYVESAEWYRKAAEQGDAEAQLELGNLYNWGQGVGRDIVESEKWYHKAAEQGNAEAQNSLAAFYVSGEGVVQDWIEAVKWYRKAAEQGNADAQVSLGNCYYSGLGVNEDKKEAVKWYRKAVKQGNCRYAPYHLGICYLEGDGVGQNYEEAVRLLHMAAANGNHDASKKLKSISKKCK